MALVKHGGPGSEHSRHINIRYFWVAERIDERDVVVEHLGTEMMFANALTKPVQGARFERERRGLTSKADQPFLGSKFEFSYWVNISIRI